MHKPTDEERSRFARTVAARLSKETGREVTARTVRKARQGSQGALDRLPLGADLGKSITMAEMPRESKARRRQGAKNQPRY